VFAITEELANVGPALGNQHTIVLPILENLCGHDETAKCETCNRIDKSSVVTTCFLEIIYTIVSPIH